MKIVRIYPKTNFHTFLNSDTLWGNIVYAYRMLYGVDKTSELIKEYSSTEIPFKVSSIFPFAFSNSEKEKITYYLPKPITGFNIRNAKDPEEMTFMKDFKKIRYVDKKLFEGYLNCEIDDNILLERFLSWQKEESKKENERNEEVIKNTRFGYKQSLSPSFFLHNSIDRMSGSTLQIDGKGQLYWEEEFNGFGNKLSLNQNIIEGIYFLADGSDVSLIEGPLRLLSHIGIGGNKSIGKGSFDFVIEDFSFSVPTNHNSFVSLSLFQPSQGEIELFRNNSVNLFYDLTTRIGKVGKDFNLEFNEKNPIICFTEGSSFFVTQQLSGRIVPTAKFGDEQDIYSSYLFFGIKANLRLQ